MSSELKKTLSVLVMMRDVENIANLLGLQWEFDPHESSATAYARLWKNGVGTPKWYLFPYFRAFARNARLGHLSVPNIIRKARANLRRNHPDLLHAPQNNTLGYIADLYKTGTFNYGRTLTPDKGYWLVSKYGTIVLRVTPVVRRSGRENQAIELKVNIHSIGFYMPPPRGLKSLEKFGEAQWTDLKQLLLKPDGQPKPHIHVKLVDAAHLKNANGSWQPAFCILLQSALQEAARGDGEKGSRRSKLGMYENFVKYPMTVTKVKSIVQSISSNAAQQILSRNRTCKNMLLMTMRANNNMAKNSRLLSSLERMNANELARVMSGDREYLRSYKRRTLQSAVGGAGHADVRGSSSSPKLSPGAAAAVAS